MPDDTRRDRGALETERLDADRRYNDALTAVDRAIVHAPPEVAAIAPPATSAAPPIPAGWRGHLLRIVNTWLAPLVAEQHAFNQRIAAEVTAAASRAHEHAAALDRFQGALIVYLQQITAFVDTKIRAAEGELAARIDGQDRALARTAELAAQIETLQRMVQSLKRRSETTIDAESAELAEKTFSVSSASSVVKDGADNPNDLTYLAFEDRFRGSDEEIRAKQSAYLPVFAGATDVLDIGCGRGEFLALLASNGVRARGIDVNGEMADVAKARGLDATRADALSYVAALPDESIGGVMCAQVVEHLEPGYLMRLLDTLSHKLRPHAPVVIETINPACWLAFFSSYIRDLTHVRPIHPDTLEYLLHASGFGRVSIQYSAPVPEHVKMAPIALPAAIASSPDPTARALAEAAHVINANAAILNSLMFTFMDYAAIAVRS